MSSCKVVLVVGLLPYDSGKTWFTTALAKSLIRNSMRVSVYKPVSAHNAWYQYATVVRSKELGILVGSDVISYLDLGLINVNDVPLINPIDILAAPRDAKDYLNSLDNYLHDLEDLTKQMVLVRLTRCQDTTYTHYVVMENINLIVDSLKDELVNLSKMLKAKEINLSHLLNLLRSSWMDLNLSMCLSKLRTGRDLIIVESFSDSITPYIGLLDYVDAIVVVYPGGALILEDLNLVRNAIKERVRLYGDFILKTSSIMRQGVRVKKVVKLEPRLNIVGTLPDDFIKEFIY